MRDRIEMFNNSVNNLTGIDEFHLTVQEIVKYNIELNWLFSVNELISLVDTIICPLIFGHINLAELGRENARENYEWQIWYDNVGRFEKGDKSSPKSLSKRQGLSDNYSPDLPEIDKYNSIFELSLLDIFPLIKQLSKEQQLFVLFYIFRGMTGAIEQAELTNDIYQDAYKTDLTIFAKQISNFIWRNDLEANKYVKSFGLEKHYEVPTFPENKLSQIDFVFSLYTFLWLKRIRFIKTAKGAENPYDTLQSLANYFVDNAVFINSDEINEIIQRFPSRPENTKEIAVLLADYYSVMNICKKSISKGNTKKYWTIRGFDLEILQPLNSNDNKSTISKRLEVYPDLRDQLSSLNTTAKDFLLWGQ